MLRLVTGDVDLDDRAFIGDGGERVRLSRREARVLAYLATRPGNAATREQLQRDVWEYAAGVKSRTVDLAIHRLRRKIEPDPSIPIALLSVYGEGYRLVVVADRGDVSDGLIGRNRELQDLLRRVASGSRWLTLVGPGGVGKTRLARALAASAPTDSHLFVRLADCQGLEEFRGKVASALGISKSDAISRALAGRSRLLLILDNLEQLSEDVTERIADWVEAAPELAVLGTCRRVLGGEREEVVRLDGLSVDAAVDLLIKRGKAARGSLTPFPELTDTLQEIVNGLDRLPLAIELAACRLATLSPADLLERLDARLTLLGGQGTERQASLQRAIDWSWDLLDRSDQEHLAALSQFAGSFQLDDAEALFEDAPRVLDRLVSASLVQFDGGYLLYESVRVYAATKLEDSPDAAQWRRRWRRACHAWADDRVATLESAEKGRAMAEIGARYADLLRVGRTTPSAEPWGLAIVVLALAAVVGRVPVETLLQLLAEAIKVSARAGLGESEAELRLARAILRRGLSDDEGVGGDLERALELAPDRSRLRRRIQLRLANRDRHIGNIDAAIAGYDALSRSCEDARDRYGLAILLVDYAVLLRRRGDNPGARSKLVEAVALYKQSGLKRLQITAQGNLSSVLRALGQVKEAMAVNGEALGECDEDDWGIRAPLLTNRANLLIQTGRFEEARVPLEAGLEAHRRLGSQTAEAYALVTLGTLQLELGELTAAEVSLRSALWLHRDSGDQRAEGVSQLQIGLARHLAGAAEDAKACYLRSIELLGAAGAGDLQGSAHCLLAMAYADLGEAELAAESLAAARSHPDDPHLPIAGFRVSQISDPARVPAPGDLASWRARSAVASRLLVQ